MTVDHHPADHHPVDALSALLDGELDAAEAGEVRAHVDTCSDCRAELDVLRDTRFRLRSLDAVEPPVDFAAWLDSAGVVVPMRRRRLLVANIGAAAAAAVAAVALLGGPAPAAAVAPEPEGAVEQHDAAVSATSAGLGLVGPTRPSSPTTMPPMDEMPSSFVAPDELAGYRLAGAFRLPSGGVHVLYEKGDHRLSLFEQRGDLGDLPPNVTRIGDVWRWDDARTGGRVVVVERGDVVVTVVGDESAEVVLDAARSLPNAEGGAPGRPFVRRLAGACGDVLEALSPAG